MLRVKKKQSRKSKHWVKYKLHISILCGHSRQTVGIDYNPQVRVLPSKVPLSSPKYSHWEFIK